MTTIKLQTVINAPIENVFNLSRDIDFHIKSASHTKERAIKGITKGKINLNETVTWKGKHFGIYLTHTSKIIQFDYPNSFTDVMIKGHFKYFAHQHIFEKIGTKTKQTDILNYKVPFGILGKLFNMVILKTHLTKFLQKRNNAIKKTLEVTS